MQWHRGHRNHTLRERGRHTHGPARCAGGGGGRIGNAIASRPGSPPPHTHTTTTLWPRRETLVGNNGGLAPPPPQPPPATKATPPPPARLFQRQVLCLKGPQLLADLRREHANAVFHLGVPFSLSILSNAVLNLSPLSVPVLFSVRLEPDSLEVVFAVVGFVRLLCIVVLCFCPLAFSPWCISSCACLLCDIVCHVCTFCV